MAVSRLLSVLGFACLLLGSTALAQFGSTTQYFPQFAIDGGATTYFTLHNPGKNPLTVNLKLTLSNGDLWLSDQIALEPGATESVSYGGRSGIPKAGWAELTSDSEFNATLFYQISGVGNVGVLPSPEATTAKVFTYVAPGLDTGFAVANPSPREACDLTFEIYHSDGNREREVSLHLGEREHRAFFFSEPPYQVDGNGSVTLRSTRPVVALALRLDGSLLSSVGVTVPNLPIRGEWNDRSPSIIGGFPQNTVQAGKVGGTISGGGSAERFHDIDDWKPCTNCFNEVTGNFGTIGGGFGNLAGEIATSNGGRLNRAPGFGSTIGGGSNNHADNRFATASGGILNVARGLYSVVAGGTNNEAGDASSTVSGGRFNSALAWASTVGGGFGSVANGTGATVPGGACNSASADYSLASGLSAKVKHRGTFMWKDATDAGADPDVISCSPSFPSTGPNQFLIRAHGGVGVNSNEPTGALHIKMPEETRHNLHLENMQGHRWFITTYGNRNQFSIGRVGVADDLVLNANGYVGIGTTEPQGQLDVNGPIYQRGAVLSADYVFKSGYQLESIEEHSLRMWQDKHLPALGGTIRDKEGKEIIELGSQLRGILEELEKAHIYIERLNRQLQHQAVQIERLKSNKSEHGSARQVRPLP